MPDGPTYHWFPISIDPIDNANRQNDRLHVAIEWPLGSHPHIGRCVDVWLPSLAPSRGLWEWFLAAPDRWYEFVRQYHLELDHQAKDCEHLRHLACVHPLTFVFTAGTVDQNAAIALRQHLQHLECRRRYAAGWIVGGLTYPVRPQIEQLGGLWYGKHKVWTMPSAEACKAIRSLLPGDF